VGSGRDGIARANLMFLDGDAPERLLAGPAHSLEH
jgi:hypothetical protein